uniref:Uncharacterized protein n=1 Tax=Anguilla anguilla TaxID=7936 RepID=A0A0E9T3Z1_ANGAN
MKTGEDFSFFSGINADTGGSSRRGRGDRARVLDEVSTPTAVCRPIQYHIPH